MTVILPVEFPMAMVVLSIGNDDKDCYSNCSDIKHGDCITLIKREIIMNGNR